MKAAQHHLPLLDAFRGLLAVWVFVGHAAIYSGYPIPFLPPPGGAVDLFMILSGFLMSYLYWDRENMEPWGQPATWSKFYLRRYFRIAPVYYLLLACAFLFGDALNNLGTQNIVDHPRAWSNTPNLDPARTVVDIWNVLLHVTFLFGLLPAFASNNSTPDWSIGLEMQFYAVFPFLMLLVRRIGWLPVAVVCTIVNLQSPGLFGQYLVPGKLAHFGQPSFLPLKINLFVMGMLLGEARYLLINRGQAEGGQLLIMAYALSWIGQYPWVQVAAIGFVLWICADVRAGGLSFPGLFREIQKRMNNPVFQFLSNTSYGVYLAHLLIITLVTGLYRRWGFYHHGPHGRQFLMLVSTAGFWTYLLAWLLHQWVELPGISLGKRVSRAVFGDKK